jgi:hypothetical protein
MPARGVAGPTGLVLARTAARGRDPESFGLRFSGLTKQFCPLPRTA